MRNRTDGNESPFKNLHFDTSSRTTYSPALLQAQASTSEITWIMHLSTRSFKMYAFMDV